jgi:hypothetical protein
MPLPLGVIWRAQQGNGINRGYGVKQDQSPAASRRAKFIRIC